MSSRVINYVFIAVPFLLSGIWLASIVYALQTCSMFPQIIGHPCKAGGGDVWMGPFLYSFFGIPATVVSIIVVIWVLVGKAIRVFSRGRERSDWGV